MPTGYTSQIAEGITFQNFALSCARAFGALIEMRDDPADAPIPDEFKPSTYSRERLAEAQGKLAALMSMTEVECEQKAKDHYEQQVQYHQEGIEKDVALKAKYTAMLESVNAWTPPTSEHEGLKKFMQEQIETSINFDCGSDWHQRALADLKPQTSDEWRAAEIAEAEHSVAYHTQEHSKEVERATSRTSWVRELRKSLESIAP